MENNNYLISVILVLVMVFLAIQIVSASEYGWEWNEGDNNGDESGENNQTITIDPLVLEKFQNQTEVYITVMLKDYSNITYENAKTKSEKREIYEAKAEYFKQAEQEVISTLTESEFTLDHMSSLINSFSGYITQEGFDKLKVNPEVLVIETDRMVYTGSQNELDNQTEEQDEEKNWLLWIIIGIVILIVLYVIFKKRT